MIYPNKSKKELISSLDEIHQKYAALMKLSETITSAHKTDLDALKASESRYRRLFETAKDGILILDAETGKIKDVNPFLIEMLGYTKDKFNEKQIWEIGFFKDIAANKDKFAELRRKMYVRYDNLPLETAGGRKINVEFVSNVYFEGHQEVIQCNIRDITERKRAEQLLVSANTELARQVDENRIYALELIKAREKAEESNRLKSAFLSNMSHEIRTPMNGILGFSALLKEPGLNGASQQEYIRIIEKSGTRMLNIINNIMDISKIESGLLEIIPLVTNINEQLEHIYNFFIGEVEQKGMQLIVKVPVPSLPVIMVTDRKKLFAILTNLVKNAIKYTSHGFIQIGFVVKDDYLEFFVKDTGIGIPADRQEAIFERFIQADISDKLALQGAGLGLSIAKAYVEILGGKIWLKSAESLGTTFYFTIPFLSVTEVKPNFKKDAPKAAPASELSTLKILIVDDDENSEKLLAIGVGKAAHKVLIAKTGAEAVDICRRNSDIDLIMMDIQMPVMDGFEATKQIRTFNKDVIIVAQTAFVFDTDRKKAFDAGCNDYLTKPILKNELHSMIDKYFSN